eukprot:TRINITY_DN7534_c0_g1_i5.p1 TRINITY_DN7534_c0_g1~~TRINITY_DN7534_c0_g1_i5.p1  ORF type:complete len:383 (+),score=39.80 TRINITY_DN7534_c0_g1_i5:120-1268(+)
MLKRLVTHQRVDDDAKRNPFAVGGGFICFGLFVYLLCSAVHQSVVHHATTEEAGQLVREVPCNWPSQQAPTSGVVHLEDCDIDLPPTAVDAIFEGFEDVVPPEANMKYAWSRLKIQHLTPQRRRSSREWETVLLDGDLWAEWPTSNGTRVGPYTLDPLVILNIPGKELKLQPPPGQQANQQPPEPVINEASGNWILNSKTMSYSEDCNCLWSGDTRITIEVSLNQPMSIVAGAAPGPLLQGWMSAAGGEVSDVAEGAESADRMLMNKLSNDDFLSKLQLAGFTLGICIGLWVMVWPADYDTFCDKYKHTDFGRCCSTFFRACVIGCTLSLVIILTAWFSFRGHIVFALLGLCCFCGMEARLETLGYSNPINSHGGSSDSEQE